LVNNRGARKAERNGCGIRSSARIAPSQDSSTEALAADAGTTTGLQPLPLLLPGHPAEAPRGGCGSRGRVAGGREAWAADREEEPARVVVASRHFVGGPEKRRGEERCGNGKNGGEEGLGSLYIAGAREGGRARCRWSYGRGDSGREAKGRKHASGLKNATLQFVLSVFSFQRKKRKEQ